MLRLQAITCIFLGLLTLVGLSTFAKPGSGAVVGEPDRGEAPLPMAASKDRSTRDKWSMRKAPEAPKSKSKYKPWNEVLKDAEKHEGLFNVYTKDEDLFFEIKADQLDKPMVNFMNISQGIGARFVLGGMPLGILETVMLDFHREKDHVQVRRLNPLFRGGGDDALEQAVALSYGNSILASLPIVSEKDGDKSILVRVNELFLSDVSDVGEWLRQGLERPVRLDDKKGSFALIKAFPENVEIDALLTFSPLSRRGLSLPQVPDERFIEIGVRYSLRMLPEEPMKPRIADDRLGFYNTLHKDFSQDSRESFVVHYINRWRLEKKDPHSAMSEPKKQIVYYLDTTIPEQYKPHVKRGIEMWQRAFEEAGFKNAIIAKDPADDPEYDADDARYNTIRWIVSDEPSFGAIGPHRTDPRTGEILESDILMEQNMIAGYRRAYRRYVGPADFFQSDPLTLFLKDPAADPQAARFIERRERFGCGCDIGAGFSSAFEFGELSFLFGGDGMDTPEEYVGEAIARVTAHEVGHGLGLRHNFKSSTAVPYEKLNDRRVVEDIGLTGSVMDYATPNVARDRGRQGYYWTPTVGTYDRWVIKWGYSEVPGDLDPEEEHRELLDTAAEATEKRHAYGTDEDTYPAGALDPDCMIWDLSDNPLEWARERMGVCEDILSSEHLVDRVVNDGANFTPLRNAVVTLLIQEYYAGSRAVRYIGGQRTARPHRGDEGGQLPLMPVSAAEQQAAMDFLIEYVFSKNAFAISPELLDMLQDDKMRNWQNNPYVWGRRFDFPLVNWIAAIQNATMSQLLHPMRLQRMVDTQYKQTDPYRIADAFSALSEAIWYDNVIPVGRTAVMQRNLQRVYLSYLIGMVLRTGPQAPAIPLEATSLARWHLTRIASRIDRTIAQTGIDDDAIAHLSESKGRIERALNAEMKSSY